MELSLSAVHLMSALSHYDPTCAVSIQYVDREGGGKGEDKRKGGSEGGGEREGGKDKREGVSEGGRE